MSNALITKLAEFVTVLRLEEPALANAIQVLLDARQKEVQRDPWCPGPYKVGCDSKHPATFTVLGPNGEPTKSQAEPTAKLIAISTDMANAIDTAWEGIEEDHTGTEGWAGVIQESAFNAIHSIIAKLQIIRTGGKLK